MKKRRKRRVKLWSVPEGDRGHGGRPPYKVCPSTSAAPPLPLDPLRAGHTVQTDGGLHVSSSGGLPCFLIRPAAGLPQFSRSD